MRFFNNLLSKPVGGRHNAPVEVPALANKLYPRTVNPEWRRNHPAPIEVPALANKRK